MMGKLGWNCCPCLGVLVLEMRMFIIRDLLAELRRQAIAFHECMLGRAATLFRFYKGM